MRFAVLGSGVVGRSLGAGLVRHGHEVLMGSRDPQAVGYAISHGSQDHAFRLLRH